MTVTGSFPYSGQQQSQQGIVNSQMSQAAGGGPLIDQQQIDAATKLGVIEPPLPAFILVKKIV